jgi:ATP-binding cassette subfamily G (WHITE) protein 2 (PDR)
MLMAIFPTLVQQIIPRFVIQRSLYEVRERPSKTYSWAAFLIANIVAEIPYQVFLGCLVWCCYYFTVFGTTEQSPERAGLILLYCVQFFIFASSFAHLLIAGLPDAETAATICTLLFSMCLTFNGVLQRPSSLPGFWIFMYRVSPLTYLVSGIAATGLHSRRVICSSTEFAVFNPPTNATCGQYMAKYLSMAPGYLINPDAVKSCEYCPLSSADQFLAGSNISWGERWWHYGIVWVYVVFNICMAVFMYWFFRARKVDRKRRGRGRKGGKKA